MRDVLARTYGGYYRHLRQHLRFHAHDIRANMSVALFAMSV